MLWYVVVGCLYVWCWSMNCGGVLYCVAWLLELMVYGGVWCGDVLC